MPNHIHHHQFTQSKRFKRRKVKVEIEMFNSFDLIWFDFNSIQTDEACFFTPSESFCPWLFATQTHSTLYILDQLKAAKLTDGWPPTLLTANRFNIYNVKWTIKYNLNNWLKQNDWLEMTWILLDLPCLAFLLPCLGIASSNDLENQMRNFLLLFLQFVFTVSIHPSIHHQFKW